MQKTRYTIDQLDAIPMQPGVYRMYNSKGELIYVGKAKNLRKRVLSYFNKPDHSSIKTGKMVKQIKDIGFTIVDNEHEALLLENNLIKQLQPRYNILLKDGKSYPYLCITQERFPRVIKTRQREPSLGEYFGPFTSGTQLQQLQKLIKSRYKIRTCKFNLSAAHIAKKKFKICLEYHLGNCLGPCENKQSESDYMMQINEIRQLLKGEFQGIRKQIEQAMQQAAKQYAFAEAQQYKEQLQAIDRYHARSLVIHPTSESYDVLAMIEEKDRTFVSYLYIRKGIVIFAQNALIEKRLDESPDSLFHFAYHHFIEQSQSEAKQVISNIRVKKEFTERNVKIPKQGDKQRLLEIALRNAYHFKKEHLHALHRKQPKEPPLKALQEALKMNQLPNHIECFDNANLQGSHPVAGMVCFREGKPYKKGYRRFHIKSVDGPDDYASMREVIYRRYSRLLQEGQPLPDLIVVDGGKGQLSSALSILKELGIEQKITIVGLAKRLEEIFFPEDPTPHLLGKMPREVQMLLQQIRDEAHRFANTFHRSVRRKQTLQTALASIPGIGKLTIQRIYLHFNTIKKLKSTPKREIERLIGKQKGELICRHFNIDLLS